ncbi:CPBP family intramembrane metalloprotease [Clostridium botulinum]|nr:CPBP family intramembrane metalloprotease [Clostridium botulinum]
MFGEEYGWRYFLQTAFQERLGKRKGIIFLGIIWGIWHLPLNLFYYSPKLLFILL